MQRQSIQSIIITCGTAASRSGNGDTNSRIAQPCRSFLNKLKAKDMLIQPKSAFLREKMERKEMTLRVYRAWERTIGESLLAGDYPDMETAAGMYRRVLRDIDTCTVEIHQLEELIREAEEVERRESYSYHKDEWESGEEYEDNTNDYEED